VSGLVVGREHTRDGGLLGDTSSGCSDAGRGGLDAVWLGGGHNSGVTCPLRIRSLYGAQVDVPGIQATAQYRGDFNESTPQVRGEGGRRAKRPCRGPDGAALSTLLRLIVLPGSLYTRSFLPSEPPLPRVSAHVLSRVVWCRVVAQVQWFWRVLEEFGPAERAKLLCFVTGSNKVNPGPHPYGAVPSWIFISIFMRVQVWF
jgi:hypothetical protein